MKVVSAQEMARLEKLAYEEGCSEEAFMEAAGQGVAQLVQLVVAQYHIEPKIALLLGRGNNAGDAFVAGRMLVEGGFPVIGFALAPLEQCSPLCQLEGERFLRCGGKIIEVKKSADLHLGEVTLIVDGLLGTGFHGKIEGLFAEVIEVANDSKLPIIAIDVPSGVHGSGSDVTTAIRATHTLFLGLPKTGCFLGEAWNYVGIPTLCDFGLPKHHLEKGEADFFLLEDQKMSLLLPTLRRTRHKYDAGYVVGIGGSSGMPGAALLSSLAALRSGAGLVRLLHPAGMESELAYASPEIIREAYRPGQFKKIEEALTKAKALFIGPGMGKTPAAARLLKRLLPHIHKPCVIDADALSLIAEYGLKIPPQAILTPHHGEMKRLLSLQEDLPPLQFLKHTRAFAEEKGVTILLKGAPTFIFHPATLPCISSHGDCGMATAGSGDVLTGIIAALLAQGLRPFDAAILAAHLHGLAGEEAARIHTSYSMIAGDIITSLPSAFKQLLH